MIPERRLIVTCVDSDDVFGPSVHFAPPPLSQDALTVYLFEDVPKILAPIP